jgi:AraC family transcriptional regulator of adaptative response / methylphosphotriester-DNA alkyltransferase methyltransferase
MKEEYWQAVVACDRTYDGVFFYAVKTTGIFCRPSCPSKAPKRDNVELFSSAQQAQAAGFRPCKRCRPDIEESYSAKASLVDKAKRYIEENYAEQLTLNRIAAYLYVSPFYLQRIFKEIEKISPAQYVTRMRINRARQLLLCSSLTITQIALYVGFKNSAHFSVVFQRFVGCQPSKYRLSDA